MSNALARKKRTSVGFTKRETEEIREFDAERKRLNDLSRCAYESLVATSFYILRIRFGFGKTRLQRFKTDVAVVYQEYRKDQIDMHKFIVQVDRDCKTDANDSVNGVPVAHKLYLTGTGGKQITNMQRIVAFKKAYALWYTTHLYVLHTIFKFSNKQISEYLEAVTDMLDTLCRYKQFAVTVPMMIETVLEETGVEVCRCM